MDSKDDSWEEHACESVCSGTLLSTRFSLNSCNHSGMSECGLPRTSSWSSFLFGFGISVGSCKNSCDVSEVNGSRRAKKLWINEESRLVRNFPYNTVFEYHFLMRCGFDRWSTHMSIHVHRKTFPAIELLAYPRGVSSSSICPILWHELRPLHAFALLHWRL